MFLMPHLFFSTINDNNDNVNATIMFSVCMFQACFASLVSQDYVNGTDQEEIRTGWSSLRLLFSHLNEVL